MAFKGDLKNISLFDVFQTLNQNQQTGVLALQREGVTKKVFFSPDGVRIFFTRSFRPLRLGEIFARRGLVSAQDIEILLLEQKRDYRPIGELLVQSGKVPREEVDHVLRYHAEDEIFEIFGWDSGSFAFYDGQALPEDGTTPLSDVVMDPAGLCLEAARRLDEMENLRTVIATNHEFFVQEEGIEPDREQNSPAVCAVFDALAEPNSVDDLRDLVGLSLFEVLRTLVLLLEGGLIRGLNLDELVTVGREAHFNGERDRAAQLLEKAHFLQPDDREILEECIDAVQRVDDPARLSVYLAALGRMSIATDEVEQGIEHLEQALRHDPDNYDALIALRDAFARQQDIEHAAEASLKLARAYASNGAIEPAVDACRVGLDIAPESIALRFYRGQLLVRADRPDEAAEELRILVRDADHQSLRSKKAQEMLASCYRLLLKIDANDEDAQRGMRQLDRARMSSLRRRKFFVRGGIAAAAVLLLGGVGLTMRAPSPDKLLEELQAAQADKNFARVIELSEKLNAEHADTKEARSALAIRAEMEAGRTSKETLREKRLRQTREALEADLEEVRAGLTDRDWMEAINLAGLFLDRLAKPESRFMQRRLAPLVEYELIQFLERVRKRADQDRHQIALSDQQLKASTDSDTETLLQVEKRLARIRARDWRTLAPDLARALTTISQSQFAGKAAPAIVEFNKNINGLQAGFDGLDALYFTVRRERLKREIRKAVDLANKNGFDLLRRCDFVRARELYEAAFKLADDVALEEPRKYYLTLLNWLEASSIRASMRRKRDQIDEVVQALAEVDRLRRAGQAQQAFLILRDLVTRNRVIQFEHRYEMPYQVESKPQGAEVFVNGKSVGRTPLSIDLPITKTADLRLERIGFAPEEIRIVPTDPKLTGLIEAGLEKETAWTRDVSGEVEAAPVIAGDLLLVATSRANVLAYKLSDGSFLWEAKTGLLDRVKSAPVVLGKSVYFITATGVMYAADLATGKVSADRRTLPGHVHHDGATDGALYYVATRSKKLVALKGLDVVYTVPLAYTPDTRVLHADGRLFIGTGAGAILVHDAKSGRELHKLRAPSGSSFFGGVAYCQGLVVGGAEDGHLYAFDAATGERSWAYRTAGPVTSPPATDGTTIYLPTRDGSVHAIDGKGEGGTRYDVGSVVGDAPALVNGFLYAIGGSNIAAFDIRDEAVWWDYDFEKEATRHVVAGEGRVVVVTESSRVLAFAADAR